MTPRALLNYLRGRRDRLERDLERELEYHIDRRVEELIARGMSEADAFRLANQELGGVARVREDVRETWTWPTVDGLALDARYALRTLTKSRAFALGVGAVLALTLAANIAVFSVVNAVLLEPLPYPNADRLVSIETLWTNTGELSQDVSGADYLDWEAQSDVFHSMAAIFGYDDVHHRRRPCRVRERILRIRKPAFSTKSAHGTRRPMRAQLQCSVLPRSSPRCCPRSERPRSSR